MEDIQDLAMYVDDECETSTPTETNPGTKKLKGENAVGTVGLQIVIENRIGKLPGEPHDNRPVTIHRLPGWIYIKNKALCEPRMVSIGPYHHRKKSLRTMEEHKWYILRSFLARNKDVGLQVYLEVLKSIESQVRSCYSETVKLGSDDFVMMLLLDGCFILEWLLKQNLPEYDAFFDEGWSLGDLLCDMCLVENQVPFFVIHKIFSILNQKAQRSPNCDEYCPLLQLFCAVLRDHILIKQFTPFQIPSEISCDQISHLLHLLYLGTVPDFQPQTDHRVKGNPNNFCGLVSFLWSTFCARLCKAVSKGSNPIDVSLSVASITELHYAGLKFKRKKEPRSLFDISLNNGTIEMPFLNMNPLTLRMLWNMVVYEQSRSMFELPDTLISYLIFMNSLINTEKDIAILEQSGIIDNIFQNAEITKLFFNQSDTTFHVNSTKHYFYGLFKDIKEYSKSNRHKYIARLMQDYFSNPWSIISVVAAGILLILTFVQTYYSAAK